MARSPTGCPARKPADRAGRDEESTLEVTAQVFLSGARAPSPCSRGPWHGERANAASQGAYDYSAGVPRTLLATRLTRSFRRFDLGRVQNRTFSARRPRPAREVKSRGTSVRASGAALAAHPRRTRVRSPARRIGPWRAITTPFLSAWETTTRQDSLRKQTEPS